MVSLDNVLIADEILEKHFVCDLAKCKGGCCVDGDCGAPLTDEEAKIIQSIYPKIKHLIPERFQEAVAESGTHVWDDEYGAVTPTIDGGICVYGYYDEAGVVKCSIEKAWREGLINFQKPISCHLYPIREKVVNGYPLLNYEPRKKLCRPACKLGAQLQVPVFAFLKDALTRRFGESFYNELQNLAGDFLQFRRNNK